MKLKIYKYESEVKDKINLEVPKDSVLQKVMATENHLTFWFLVNPLEKDKEIFRFIVYGTGHDIYKYDLNVAKKAYIDTVRSSTGLVWHIFRNEWQLR